MIAIAGGVFIVAGAAVLAWLGLGAQLVATAIRTARVAFWAAYLVCAGCVLALLVAVLVAALIAGGAA